MGLGPLAARSVAGKKVGRKVLGGNRLQDSRVVGNIRGIRTLILMGSMGYRQSIAKSRVL